MSEPRKIDPRKLHILRQATGAASSRTNLTGARKGGGYVRPITLPSIETKKATDDKSN